MSISRYRYTPRWYVAKERRIKELEAALEQERISRAPAEDGWAYETRRASKLTERVAELEVMLAATREQAARGERLREAVTRDGLDNARYWRYAARGAEERGQMLLVDRCTAIAAALEAEQEVGVDPAAPEGSKTVTMIVEPEPLCAHGAAEWGEGVVVPEEGWWGDEDFFFGYAGGDCRRCGKLLPPKPWWLLSWEETAERLPPVFEVSRCYSGLWDGRVYRSGGWIKREQLDSELALRRALVAAVEEVPDED